MAKGKDAERPYKRDLIKLQFRRKEFEVGVTGEGPVGMILAWSIGVIGVGAVFWGIWMIPWAHITLH